MDPAEIGAVEDIAGAVLDKVGARGLADELFAGTPGTDAGLRSAAGDQRLTDAGAARPRQGRPHAIELDFRPAYPNAEVEKVATKYPHIEGPDYRDYPAVEEHAPLEGTNSKYDTVIVGGGLNGARTARLLAEQGQRVAVLERGLVAGRASSAAMMVTRALDVDYQELAGKTDQLGKGELFGDFLGRSSQARLAVRVDALRIPGARAVNSYMFSYAAPEGEEWLEGEYNTVHAHDTGTRLLTGEDAAKVFPAVGNRPAASTVLSWDGEAWVNSRGLTKYWLDHPNIDTYEGTTVDGIRIGQSDDHPVEVHTTDGAVVHADHVVSAINGLPTMFDDSVPLLSVEHAGMVVANVPADYPDLTENRFDIGSFGGNKAIPEDDEDNYDWFAELHPTADGQRQVALGGGSTFLTEDDAVATRGSKQMRKDLAWTLPGAEVTDKRPYPLDSPLYRTETGGPLVLTHPESGRLIAISGGGGTGFVNSDMAARAVTGYLRGEEVPEMYAKPFHEALAELPGDGDEGNHDDSDE